MPTCGRCDLRRRRNAVLGLAGVLLFTISGSAAAAQAGSMDLILLGSGGFSGNTNPGNDSYYSTGLNSYSLTGNLGFWLDDDWEAGVGGGPGRLQSQNCSNPNTCVSATHASAQFTVFGRYNFTSDYGVQYSFTGLQVTYISSNTPLGNVTVLQPVAGYRFSLISEWSLELSVGVGVPVAGNTSAYPTSYDVQMGVVIPL